MVRSAWGQDGVQPLLRLGAPAFRPEGRRHARLLLAERRLRRSLAYCRPPSHTLHTRHPGHPNEFHPDCLHRIRCLVTATARRDGGHQIQTCSHESHSCKWLQPGKFESFPVHAAPRPGSRQLCRRVAHFRRADARRRRIWKDGDHRPGCVRIPGSSRIAVPHSPWLSIGVGGHAPLFGICCADGPWCVLGSSPDPCLMP